MRRTQTERKSINPYAIEENHENHIKINQIKSLHTQINESK